MWYECCCHHAVSGMSAAVIMLRVCGVNAAVIILCVGGMSAVVINAMSVWYECCHHAVSGVV